MSRVIVKNAKRYLYISIIKLMEMQKDWSTINYGELAKISIHLGKVELYEDKLITDEKLIALLIEEAEKQYKNLTWS